MRKFTKRKANARGVKNMGRADSLKVGLFLSASNAIEDFGCNLYFSYMLQETISQHMQIESELEEARRTKDTQKINQLEAEIAILDGAYQLSSLIETDHNQ